MKFFLGSNDQIKQMQRRHQFLRHLGRGDKTAFALAVTGQAPQIGTEIDIKRGFQTLFTGNAQSFQHCRLGLRVG